MNDQEGLGGAVEGAGSEGLGLPWDNVAEVVVGLGGFPKGEPGVGSMVLIRMVEQVLQRVQEVT